MLLTPTPRQADCPKPYVDKSLWSCLCSLFTRPAETVPFRYGLRFLTDLLPDVLTRDRVPHGGESP